jgi:hypothetical protein
VTDVVQNDVNLVKDILWTLRPSAISLTSAIDGVLVPVSVGLVEGREHRAAGSGAAVAQSGRANDYNRYKQARLSTRTIIIILSAAAAAAGSARVQAGHVGIATVV